MIIMVIDTIFPFFLVTIFFSLLPWQLFCLLGGVGVRQHHSYRLLFNSLTQILYHWSKVFVVHCEAMLFLSMILTFLMITQNQ